MKRVLILLALVYSARADADAYLRVIAQKAPVHSGPGASYREVAVAKRNEVYQVIERSTREFWFKIELDDGTTGWILGDMVYPFEVGPEQDLGVLTLMGRARHRAGPEAAPVITG